MVSRMDIVMGFMVGLALVAPVGPISLLLVGVGIERGRTSGLFAGLGVAGADIALLGVVLALSGWLTELDAGPQRVIETLIGAVLLGVGIHALARRHAVAGAIERIRHPARALAIATVANPLTIAVWLGLVASLRGEQTTGWGLAQLGLGLALATTVWHVGLGVAAGTVGGRLGERARVLLQRASGVVMIVLGAGLAW